MLRQSSAAYRVDRELQRRMRQDPDIMAPLSELQLAVAGMPWSIKCDEPLDAGQLAAAKEMTKWVRRIPNLAMLQRSLLEAVWYGPAAVNIVYARPEGDEYPRVAQWIPIHGDTLVFREDGWLGMRVGPRYYANSQGADEGQRTTGFESTDIGYDSRIHYFDTLERGAIVLHRHYIEAPDFDEPWDAGVQYAGRGLRDVCWYFWRVKQTILQNWATFCERYAMGVRKGWFRSGNPNAEAAMVSVLQNLVGDVNVTLPMDQDGNPEQDIEILEPNAGQAQIYLSFVEWLSGKCKELIIGQSATSEAVSTGLGSSVGDKHAETKSDRVRYAADALGETLTKELIHRAWAMRHGNQPCPLRFEYQQRTADPEAYLKAVEKATDIGIKVPQADVREQLGIREPMEGEAVIERAYDPSGMFGGAPGADTPDYRRALAGGDN